MEDRAAHAVTRTRPGADVRHAPVPRAWEQLEERYGKSIVRHLAMPDNEGIPSYISSAVF